MTIMNINDFIHNQYPERHEGHHRRHPRAHLRYEEEVPYATWGARCCTPQCTFHAGEHGYCSQCEAQRRPARCATSGCEFHAGECGRCSRCHTQAVSGSELTAVDGIGAHTVTLLNGRKIYTIRDLREEFGSDRRYNEDKRRWLQHIGVPAANAARIVAWLNCTC